MTKNAKHPEDVDPKPAPGGIDYRRLLEGLPGAPYQFLIGKNGTYHFPYMGERCIDLFGRTAEEIMADAAALFQRLPPADAEAVNRAIEASAETLSPYSQEHRVITPDGETIWVHASAIPRKLPTGDIIWDGFSLDITERKSAECALRESEEKFRLAFETSPDSINLNRLDDGRYIDLNDGFTKIIGYTRREAIGKTSIELNIWDDPKDRERLISMLKRNGYAENLEARFRAKDGAIKYGLMSARILQLKGEAVILSITRDITDRKRHEETIKSRILALTQPDIDVGALALTDVIGLDILQEVQDAFSAAFKIPAIIYDKNGAAITRPSNFTDFCRLIRSSPEGRRRCEGFNSKLSADLSRTLRPVIRKGCAVHNIVTGAVPIVVGGRHIGNIGMGQMIDGDFHIGQLQSFAEEIGVPSRALGSAAASLMPFEKNRFETVLAFLNTLAEQLGLLGLQNLQQARFIHEREHLTHRLGQVQKMESLGTLAGGIAHDFNNILFPIMGYAEMLLDDAPEGSLARKNLEKILAGTIRARELVRQILTFSRQANEEVQPVRVQIILKEALKLIRATLPTTIDIQRHIDPSCLPVMADPTRIHQVIMNLITNAYHAMQDSGGVLDIRLETIEKPAPDVAPPSVADTRYICLTVADTGHGIPADLLEKIFDPYFTTKEKDKGTGLGLSMVHGIVKNCGGAVQVESQPGAGAVFRVYLPVKETTADARTAPADIPGGTEHLLMVDDEPAVVYMGKAMLERLGYRVTPETGSEAALETFRTHPDRFDLVVTDMTMPGMTGVQLASRLREIRPDVKIVICTGFSDLMDEKKAADYGIQGFILKPVVKAEIAAKIREALDAH